MQLFWVGVLRDEIEMYHSIWQERELTNVGVSMVMTKIDRWSTVKKTATSNIPRSSTKYLYVKGKNFISIALRCIDRQFPPLLERGQWHSFGYAQESVCGQQVCCQSCGGHVLVMFALFVFPVSLSVVVNC